VACIDGRGGLGLETSEERGIQKGREEQMLMIIP
jgi:hypothetical protein